jgi:DNA-binding MarR family transcriptional regulator
MEPQNASNEASLPALLRAARNACAQAIRAELVAAGMGDLPRNGVFVLGAIARDSAPLADVVRQLGASKQAAGQLVDTLVNRGYLDREVDAADRRRLTVSLTGRGVAAARLARAAGARMEADLIARIGAANVAHARAALLALAGVGDGN